MSAELLDDEQRKLPFAPVCHHHVQVQERYSGGLGLCVLLYVGWKSTLLNRFDQSLIECIWMRVAHSNRCNGVPRKVIENPFVREVIQVDEAQRNFAIVAGRGQTIAT